MSQELNAPLEDIIKVSGSSNPQSVGSIVARAVIAKQQPKIRAIGASAVNQAVKACAIARGFVAPRGVDLTFVIGFDDIEGENGRDPVALRPWKANKDRGPRHAVTEE
jgi:stage V sporulation protein S